MSNKDIQLNELKLFRCTIIEEKGDYFIGKDILNNKYHIKKGENTKKYKIGTDDSFYARVIEKGFLQKKTILYPVTSKEYDRLLDTKGIDFSIIDDEVLHKIRKI